MKKIKVVFVDDEPMICMLFPRFIESSIAEVTTYTSPTEALAQCLKEPPDLIFTDYNMPKLNGEELAQLMPKNIPIYLISGHITSSDSLDYKFREILSKPFSFEKINEIVRFRFGEVYP